MGNKKNIDRLFQEKFKNFEAIPNDAMWDTIQSKLDEKDSNKKRFPIWMMFSGVAATVMIFVALSVSLLSTDEGIEKIVVAPQNQNLISPKKPISDEKGRVLLVNQKSQKIIDTGLKKRRNITTDDIIKDVVSSTGVSPKSQDVVTFSATISKKLSRGSNVENNNTSLLSSENFLEKKNGLVQDISDEIVVKKIKAVGLNNNEFDIVKSKNDNRSIERWSGYSSEMATSNEKLSTQLVVVNVSKPSVDSIKNYEVSGKSINKIDTNTPKENSTITNSNIQEGALVSNQKVNLKYDLTIEEENVGIDSIVAKSGIKNMSSKVVLDENLALEEECIDESIEKPTEKTIEEAVAELEEKQSEEENKEEEIAFNKWEIAPNIAPVYYNTLSSGSPIDSEFSGNKKKGKINMSYGLGVGYAISKKITLRTGINKVSLGFDTEDVAVNTNPETVGSTRGMKNINLSPAVSSLNIASSESFSIAQIPSSFSSLYNSSLNQRLGYLEIPLELSYKISDKKMKIDIIAGMSTFFLNENDIYTRTNSIETHIGEANNLNKMSYSTNIGLGFNYNISKAFNFNFEPTFKYQLNAFSNDSGNFKPYILGVYTGFSFKF